MPKETPAQAATVARVMHEFRRDELRSAGQKVRNPRQAIAIGLSEAGVSREKTPQQNRRPCSGGQQRHQGGSSAPGSAARHQGTLSHDKG